MLDFKINPLIQYFFGKLLSILSGFIPKNKRKVLFFSIPDFSDNPKYVYDKMLEYGLNKYFDLLWVTKEKIEANHVIKKQYSLKFLYHIMTAKYLFTSHGSLSWKSSNQTLIMLWHGFPTKALERTGGIVTRLSFRDYRRNIDYFISTSELGSVLFSSRYLIPRHRFIELGQPRCDELFSIDKERVKKLENMFGEKIEGKKIILYVPSYRFYDEDYILKQVNGIYKNKRFNEYLTNNDIIFIYKPHPFDELKFKIINEGKFRILNNDKLKEYELNLNDLMILCNILITDYSSVYKDYMILDKPIIFFCPDINTYRHMRGMILEPFEIYAPGDKAYNIHQLIESIDKITYDCDEWAQKRSWLRDIMHDHLDGFSSDRVVKWFLSFYFSQ